MKLYIDGCSYFYGHYLDRNYALGSLLSATVDKSAPGKSNNSMLEDLYKNINDYDTFIIGFTFSTRYSFDYLGKRLYIYPNKKIPNLGDHSAAASDEGLFNKLVDLYYYFSDVTVLDLRSDIYIDSAIRLLEHHNKKFIIASWEPRNIKHKNLFYPKKMLAADMFLPDRHLNEKGMTWLANKIKEMM